MKPLLFATFFALLAGIETGARDSGAGNPLN
jgi:hypothetical protein